MSYIEDRCAQSGVVNIRHDSGVSIAQLRKEHRILLDGSSESEPFCSYLQKTVDRTPSAFTAAYFNLLIDHWHSILWVIDGQLLQALIPPDDIWEYRSMLFGLQDHVIMVWGRQSDAQKSIFRRMPNNIFSDEATYTKNGTSFRSSDLTLSFMEEWQRMTSTDLQVLVFGKKTKALIGGVIPVISPVPCLLPAMLSFHSRCYYAALDPLVDGYIGGRETVDSLVEWRDIYRCFEEEEMLREIKGRRRILYSPSNNHSR